MEFYFKTVDEKVHLYREDGLFDDDLGELEKTWSGKLKTRNLFRENFVLEDISGIFSKGEKYAITSSKGLKGIIEKKAFGDRYILQEDKE